jgi:diguanylate cyclase (GGDEF)-like protein
VPSSRRDLADRLRSAQPTLRRTLTRAEVLTRLIRAVNSSLDPERVAEAIVSQVAEWVPVPAWLVLVIDDAGRTRAMGGRGLTSELEATAHAVGGWVMGHRAVFSTADASADRRAPRFGGDLAPVSAIGFPLECRGRTLGALVALDSAASAREPRLLSGTLDAFLAIIEPGAIALDNALRLQRAEALSVTDDLTQLYNSRYLSQVLRRETKRALRSARPLSLLFVDLDGFKSVNDTHGHLFGSRALVEAAGVIRTSARETDVVARYGGDEFALVLPETGREGALAVGERIRERIADFHFLESQGLDVRLTVSIGLATMPDVAMTSEGLIQAADDAMYHIKAVGKNGIHVAEHVESPK